jgi:PAS domain S-box-containing protein
MARPDGWIYWYNERWYEYTGTTLEEMQGWGWQKVHHPDHVDQVVSFAQEAWNKSEPFELTFLLKSRTGEYRWFLTRVYPVKDAEGRVVRWIGTNTDIDEQKKTEESLVESQERFRKIADEAPAFIFMANVDMQVEFLNKTWLDYTGMSFDEAIGRAWENVTHPDDYETAVSIFMDAVKAQKPYAIEVRHKNKEDQYRWIHWRGIPRYLPNGQFMGYMGLGIDIHDRKRAEEEIHRYIDRLEQSNKELEQFAMIAAHDLKEPLRKIQVFSDMLVNMVPHEGQELLSRMQSASNRMQRLLEDLFTLSSIGRQGKPFTPVDLNKVVETVVDDLQVVLAETKGQIIVSSLPVIQGDPSQVQQLFQNLIGNGLKYYRDGVPPQIKVYSEVEDRYYKITIEDNGIGIAPEYHGRIFEPFQRLHGPGEYQGTGMGLAICKKIVERHQGYLSVISTLKKGSRFSFTIPISNRTVRQTEDIQAAHR